MDRDELRKYISDTYKVNAEHPWIQYPSYEVFRHTDNQKWFALAMDVPKDKLGFRETEILQVLNLKCEPVLIGSLLSEPGFFPAYHMNKNSWITVDLYKVSDDEIRKLTDMSFQMTASRKKVRYRDRNFGTEAERIECQ
jgi:predicted DNA-binding protein (MmcQ/YjbR family)